MYISYRSHDLLPKLFLNVAIKKNVGKSIRTTRQYNLLVKKRDLEHMFRLSSLNIILQ